MKNCKLLVGILTAMAVSVASSKAQLLDLSGGTVVQLQTNQELVGTSPGNVGANDGYISTWVVNDSALDSSGYIFIYQLINNSPDTITGVQFNRFVASEVIGTGSYSNIIGSLSLAGSFNPNANPSTGGAFKFNAVTAGGAATFDSSSLLNGGTPGWFLVIDTDVTSINNGFATTEDDFTADGNILAPHLAPVPEPASSVLILGGLASLYCLFRFRRAAN